MLNTILLKYKLGDVSYYDTLKAIINQSNHNNIIQIDNAIKALYNLYAEALHGV